MIKLQLLLRHPGAEPELAAALRALLEASGLHVTGCGRASVSAEVSNDGFARLFGTPPAVKDGFAAGLAEPALPIPAPLADAVSLITMAPQHSVTNRHPQDRHAAI